MADTPFICTTCGTQHAESEAAPATCAICADERQWVPPGGSTWTTLPQLRTRHRAVIQRLELDLYGVGCSPDFAIGQRALLVRTPHGNILWDCISLLDDALVDVITAFGGLRAIAISHPHYYTTMVDWAHAFGVPAVLHARDRQWVMRPDATVTFWDGLEHTLLPGVRLVHCGGHFAGGTVLLWEAGAEGKGAVLSGDILQVVPDGRFVSFMRSYPNLIPLPPAEVDRIARVMAPLRFERLYGPWWDRPVVQDAHEAVQASARRYVEWVRGERALD